MNLEKSYIYHIYNQGNNRQKIFFQHRNYEFFREKISTHVKPYADILAYCLMPNHFHLMVLVKELELPKISEGFAQSEALAYLSINQSIGIMLRSYTNAINKQENRSGALFRKQTKSECVNCPNGVAPSFITKDGVTEIIQAMPELQYPQVCFNYIHLNPVKAGLVKRDEDWAFSSAGFYSGVRDDELVNIEVAKEYVDVKYNSGLRL
jgi:putative transposase